MGKRKTKRLLKEWAVTMRTKTNKYLSYSFYQSTHIICPGYSIDKED
jgi:hypothetical protein